MSQISQIEVIEVRLPRHLILWLKNVSKRFAMTPSQLIANILEYYYEVWKVGVECGAERKTTNIEEILEE